MTGSVESLLDMSGKVAVVTGAASGMGRATTIALAQAGADVVIGDIDVAGMTETAAEASRSGRRVIAVETDVTSREQVFRLVETASEEFGQLDIMANIAGILVLGKVVDLEESAMDRALDVNFKGVLFGCQAALQVMIPQGSGNIVNIASGVLDMAQGAPGSAPYSVSKAAVAMLTKVVAVEAAPHGIRVNTVSPGWVESAFTMGRLDSEEERAESRERARRMNPLRMTGTPEHVAHAILYLVSDAAAYVTGQTLHPNGGATMPW